MEDKQLVENFIQDPEKKKKAAELAHQILLEFKDWFTIPRLIKKFNLSKVDAAKKVELLMLFNLCTGKVEKNIPYFKIDLDRKIQRQLIIDQIEQKEGEILFLKEKLSTLD